MMMLEIISQNARLDWSRPMPTRPWRNRVWKEEVWVTSVVLAIEPPILKLEWLEKNINHCKLEFVYLWSGLTDGYI